MPPRARRRRLLLAVAALLLAAAGALLLLSRGGRPRRARTQTGAGPVRSHRPRRPHRPLPSQPTAAASLRAAAEPRGELALVGRVVDEEGRPAAGALVGIDAEAPIETTAADDGGFRLQGLLAREYLVEARLGDAYAGPIPVLPTPRAEPLLLRLRRGVTLRVRVRDGIAGAAVAGAEVQLLAPAALIETTDAEGRATLAGLAPGSASLRVTAPGLATAWPVVDIVGAGTQDVEVTLGRGARVAGRVIGPDGAPVAGARVAIEHCQDSAQQAEAAAVTDADGRWALPDLPESTYLLVAGHPDFAPGQAFVEVAKGGADAEVTIRLRGGARVRGKVVDDAGAPVALAEVTALPGGGEDSGYRFAPPARAFSDAAGEFWFGGLEGGSATLSARHEDGTSPPVDVDLAAGRAAEVVLAIARGLSIRGVVTTPTGAPVEGATVSAFPMSFRIETHGGSATVVTGADGAFALRGLSGSHWELEVRAPGHTAATIAVSAGTDDVRVELAPAARLRGRLRFADGRAPAELEIRRFHIPTRFADTDGAFHLDDLAAGPVELEASGPEFVDTTLPSVDLAAGQDLDLGTITVDRGRTVRGRVVEPDGSPAAGARIRIGVGLETFLPRVRKTAAGADGGFRVVGMPSDELEIEVWSEHGRLPRGDRVAAGGDIDLGALQLVANDAPVP